VGQVVVTFEEIGKRFGNRSVLAGVSGQLRPGVVLVVTGPNGAGKSTLLNILSGLIPPSRGVVRYQDGGSELPRERWFSVLGVVAPDMAMYEELSALENLRLFTRLRGLPSSDASLASLLSELGLAPREHHRPVATYSSGMKQRVKLAQAIVHAPPVLLLDEPSSNLDAAGHELVAALLARQRASTAIAVATNDPREIAWGDEEIELAG
jgi:heme exporter protein A